MLADEPPRKRVYVLIGNEPFADPYGAFNPRGRPRL